MNPHVDHPRWSQATERFIGSGGILDVKRQPTLLFNGYADQVASLYRGMDLRENLSATDACSYQMAESRPASGGVSALLWLVLAVDQGWFSADPSKDIQHFTGRMTLKLLLATLAIAPLARYARQPLLICCRRLVGLWCFAWARCT